jgi:hypothetical protein
MADIARRREERQTLVEQRRTNPLYIAHEREFKELLAVQSQSTKVRSRFLTHFAVVFTSNLIRLSGPHQARSIVSG